MTSLGYQKGEEVLTSSCSNSPIHGNDENLPGREIIELPK